LLVPGVGGGGSFSRVLVRTGGGYYFYPLCLHDLCLASSLQRAIGMALFEHDTPPHSHQYGLDILALEPRSQVGPTRRVFSNYARSRVIIHCLSYASLMTDGSCSEERLEVVSLLTTMTAESTDQSLIPRKVLICDI